MLSLQRPLPEPPAFTAAGPSAGAVLAPQVHGADDVCVLCPRRGDGTVPWGRLPELLEPSHAFILSLFFLQQHGKGSVALCAVKLYEFLVVAR